LLERILDARGNSAEIVRRPVVPPTPEAWQQPGQQAPLLLRRSLRDHGRDCQHRQVIEGGRQSQVRGDVLVLARGKQARCQNDIRLGIDHPVDCFVGRSNDHDLVVQRLLDESPENYTSFRVRFDSEYPRHGSPRENDAIPGPPQLTRNTPLRVGSVVRSAREMTWK